MQLGSNPSPISSFPEWENVSQFSRMSRAKRLEMFSENLTFPIESSYQREPNIPTDSAAVCLAVMEPSLRTQDKRSQSIFQFEPKPKVFTCEFFLEYL